MSTTSAGQGGLLDPPGSLSTAEAEPKAHWRLALLALFYKNASLYKKNYVSNICQILTPLLCLCFTIIVRVLVQANTTGSVAFTSFPQPFHLPLAYRLIPGLKMHCSQKYYYSLPSNDSKTYEEGQRLFHSVLKMYCHESGKLQPQFIFSDHANKNVMEELVSADHAVLKRGKDILASIPDGIVKITKFENESFFTTLSINDWRLPQYHQNNGVTKLDIHSEDQLIVTYLRVTEGLMSLVEKVTRSYLQLNNQKEIISGMFMYMPFDGVDKSVISKATSILGSGLYSLGLSLLLPIFLYGIVSQKQEKLMQIMKMNGLLMKYYWISFFVFNFLLSMLSCCILYFAGKYLLKIVFFSQTSWTILFALFIGWSVAQVSLTAFVQIFINNSKTATIVGYLLSIFSALVSQAICDVVYPYPSTLPFPMLMYPPLALARGVYLIGYSCTNNSSCFQDIMQVDHQMHLILVCLYSWFFMFVLSTYLHDIVQQEYGASKPPLWLKYLLESTYSKQLEIETEGRVQGNHSSITQKDEEQIEINEQCINYQKCQNQVQIDSSVKIMSQTTKQLKTHQRPLIIKDIYKTYDNGHQALKPNSFHLQQKEIFGLLGPNGAGKTTLMSVLTGLYKETGGAAWVDGQEIGSQFANLRIGVCPQFDLLWDQLTVYQHMKFYGMLKGVNLQLLDQKINSLLIDVDLFTEKNQKSLELSGGMKRRLSLAISLIGNPRVVFLDEPSSGLDPSHRRQMWQILKKCKKATTIFLTTHLMEQADALCDRIGIINKGMLRCLGSQKYLKERFGKGYRLTLNFKEWTGERSKITEQLLQLGCEIVNDLQNRRMLKVQKQKMLDCVKMLKKCDNLSWLLSQPSLYDVFMHFVE